MPSWEQIYDFFGIREFIYFVSSPSIQAELLPVKIVFILFSVLFLFCVFYLYSESSYIKYQFLQDVIEFFSWKAYGLREIEKRWARIMKGVKSGTENEYKLAVIEADDFLYETLEEAGYKGETFDELIARVNPKMLPNFDDLVSAHSERNSIVYDPNYRLDPEKGKKILSNYESAIKALSLS